MFKIGNLEITDNELNFKSLTKNISIGLNEIKEVSYKEPGRINAGILEINPFYGQSIKVNVKKKENDEAIAAYNFLNSITQQNSFPIEQIAQDPELLTLECHIQEERQNIFANKQIITQKAFVKLEDDRIIVDKSGVFTKRDKGSKTVLFQDVTSIDLDRGTLTSYIILTIAGSPGVTLQHPSNEKLFKFYDLLHYKYDTYKTNSAPQQNIVNNPQVTSDTDELLKWHELKEKGVITEEEFEAKKKEILGL